MANHTPGPWVSGWNGGLTGPTTPSASGPSCGGREWGFWPVAKGDQTIAICPDQDAGAIRFLKGTGEANARLIACAPELLAALIEAREELNLYHIDQSGEDYNNPELNALIAKATGETE